MQPFPPEVSRRLEVARGARLVFVYDDDVRGRARATFYFRPETPGRFVPLSVTVDGVTEARWAFAERPTVRVAWWLASRVDNVDFASVRAFGEGAGTPSRIRVAVSFGEGAGASASLVVEGDGAFIGPVDRPVPQQAVPAAYGNA